jgi:flagellar protein FliS
LERLYQKYQKNQVMTVSNEKLLLMLFEGLVRFIKSAQSALVKGDIAEVSNNLIKAQSILCELMASLDRSTGKLADDLFGIYEFMYRSLVEANVKKDEDKIQQVLEMAVDLQETWTEVARILSLEKEGAASAAW